MWSNPIRKTDRQPAAVLHDLLTAGTFIGFYDDAHKVAEFATAAINSVPGVAGCTVQLAGTAPEPDPQQYAVEIQTIKQRYGWVTVTIGGRQRFEQFQTAVHNFTNTVALRLENLADQASLEQRVREQTEALELSRAFLESIFEHTGDAISVLDRDLRVVRANHTVRELLTERLNGATRQMDDIAEPSPFFAGRRSHPDCAVRKAFETGTVHTSIAPFPSAEDPQRWFAISAFPITDRSGTVMNVIESGRDITELKQLQDSLARTVQDKDLLLKEVHHRVKNNLNMVISILNLQFAPLADERVETALTASVDRIQSMALVHQFLYQADSQRSIDVQAFLDRLVDELAGNYAGGAPVQIGADIAKVQIRADVAVPLSLIVNELITNALKYAFPRGTPGTIDVNCRTTDENVLVLTVTDDGVGLPPTFDLSRCDSLGMRLVQGLTEQLAGSVDFSPAEPGADSPGTRCTVRIPLD